VISSIFDYEALDVRVLEDCWMLADAEAAAAKAEAHRAEVRSSGHR